MRWVTYYKLREIRGLPSYLGKVGEIDFIWEGPLIPAQQHRHQLLFQIVFGICIKYV